MKALRVLFSQGFGIKGLSILTIFLASLLPVLIAATANSNPPDQIQLATPYTQPDEQVFPAVAAQIVDVSCFASFSGFLFSFSIGAFESCWAPIYSIHICYTTPSRVTAISCPAGWRIDDSPGNLIEDKSINFLTQNNPINPGQVGGPFVLYSESNHLRISWYPTDSNGNLLGKVSMETLTCATPTDATTWGQVKALYR